MSTLRIGRALVEVDPELLRMAAPRCDASGWGAVPAPGEVQLELRRGQGELPPGAVPLDPRRPGAGGYAAGGQGRLLVWIPGTPEAADAALRLLFAAAFEAQGGALLHAAGIALGGHALVAAGRSGAGKSTLARACAEAGLGLDVLSDETLGLLADGTVWATPFHSTARAATPSPQEPRDLRALVFLEHAPEERLVPMDGPEAARQLLGQMYAGPFTDSAGRLRRAAALVERAAPGRLGLRRHPAAATYVRDLLR